MTSLFIVEKNEGNIKLPLKIISKELTHKKFSYEDIRVMEMFILEAINFRIPISTLLEETKIFFQIYLRFCKSISLSNQHIEEIKKKISLLCRLVLYEENLVFYQ